MLGGADGGWLAEVLGVSGNRLEKLKISFLWVKKIAPVETYERILMIKTSFLEFSVLLFFPFYKVTFYRSHHQKKVVVQVNLGRYKYHYIVGRIYTITNNPSSHLS